MPIFKSAGLRGNHKLNWDLRPQIFISTFNGSYSVGDRGLTFEWREGASNPTGWLLNTMTAYYNSGYRRIMLYLPAGHVSGDSNFGSDQWNTLPDYKKDFFRTDFKQWIRTRPDCAVGIYQGWRIASGNTTGHFKMLYTPDTIPSFTRPGHLWFVLATMLPWIQCGISFFGLDFAGAGPSHATGATPAYLMPWAKFFMDKYNVELHGEACDGSNPSLEINDWKYKMNIRPCYSTYPNHVATRDPSGTWVVDPRTQRYYIGCVQPGTTLADMSGLNRRGFRLESYNYFDSGYILNIQAGDGGGYNGGGSDGGGSLGS